MENMENKPAAGQGTEQQPGNDSEKIFSQEDVNRIVQERLARVKTAHEPDERELELQRRENELYAREQIAEHGLPKETIEDFKGMDKQTVDKCIKIIAPYVKKMKEPFYNPVGPTNGTIDNGDAIRKAMGLKR